MIYTAVLDTSAVIAYTRESVHVGELLQDIGDEEQYALVPVVCLIEAAAEGADEDRLRLLVAHDWVKVIELNGYDWTRLGAGTALLGRLGRACSALLAVEGSAWYAATCDPDVYGDGIDTVEIEG
ncbi:hypothetical protein [Dactylosporangium darangshiense]|uniref:PIN domain-containing protein n=1 Tax=Dactylosporangium darangshiense TaxID=579108 RepID=A0ABP8DQ64_9ACTN